MEPFHVDNVKDDDQESEEIFDLLPLRFREISGSSTAMESFNFMNDDLISHRIIPSLHSRLRSLIPNAKSGLIANRLRHLVDSAPPSLGKCSLLFRVIDFSYHATEMKFIECAIRDKRLSPFTHHEFTVSTVPHISPIEPEFSVGKSFVEAIGNKVIFRNEFDLRQPFCYIMNAEHNSGRIFRALDTSSIARELQVEPFGMTLNAVVGDRLIVLLLDINRDGAPMLSLDVNTERWSVLPECPGPGPFYEYYTIIPSKGKLYLVDINSWVFRGTNDPTKVVPMHFDFQSNVWVVGEEENTMFARSLMRFSRYCHSARQFLVNSDSGRCIITSKSGILYAISHSMIYFDDYPIDEYPIGNICAMDDLAKGWTLIQTRKSEHTGQVDPFKLPNLPPHNGIHNKINCWEINEHDILLVVIRTFKLPKRKEARCAWWTFNKDDGVKNYGWEEFALENGVDISVLKIDC